jgi:hypothetical protein
MAEQIELLRVTRHVAFRIIWRSVSEIFGVLSDLLYDLRQTGA